MPVELGQHLVQRRRDAVEAHRRAALEADDDLAGAPSGRRRRHACARRCRRAGRSTGSSMAPHSTARPTMFSSTEYGLSSETVIGMPKRAAYSMESGRVKPHMRTGASTSRSGASVRRLDLEPHLVVALAGAAVGDRVGRELAGRGHEMAGDHRPRQRRHEWVLPLVERVRLDRVDDEPGRVLLAGVDDPRLDRTGDERALADRLPVGRVGVRLLADVDRERDHLRAPLLLDPLHRDGGVEPARVREHHALGHVVLSLVSQSPASAAKRPATDPPPTASAQTSSNVSSPATVPSTSG